MTISKKNVQLPEGIPPIGVSEAEAAKLWGISHSAFSKLDAEIKPKARRLCGRKVFAYIELQNDFLKLPLWDDNEGTNTDDDDGWSVN
jgi:hypothetical protein